MESEDSKEYKFTVKPLQGIADYPHCRRNTRGYLARYDPPLLSLERKPTNRISDAIL